MRRKVNVIANESLVELTEELQRIGAPDAVLVRVVDGDSPCIIISRPPTFEEAMQTTLTDHGDALRTLAITPDKDHSIG